MYLLTTLASSHSSISPALTQTHKVAVIASKSKKLIVHLNCAGGCVIDQLEVQDRQVVDSHRGMWSGIQVGGSWYTTAKLEHPPKISRSGDSVQVSGIDYGGGGMTVDERWTLTPRQNSVAWKIERRYLNSGVIDATAMPLVSFKDMSTWTGAVLGSGGVAWCKLLDSPNSTYGVQTDTATFWNRNSDPCLRISASAQSGGVSAMRFTREPSGNFSMASCLTRETLKPKHDLARFLRDRQDIWAPFHVTASETVSETFELQPLSYGQVYQRGNLKGLDQKAITEMVNTIGRIGVIDRGLVGTNGWYSGYVCLHEPWQARIGTAIDDPNYTRSEAEFLDYAQAHAIEPDGMVKSRWYYNAGDAQPGTFDPKTGFYEAQWGRLMDSQTSYVWNVADQFDQSGDRPWVARHKKSCEAALDYLLRRDANHNGLVEMQNKSIREKRSSDWLDIVWASNENAFVNAQLYGALNRWASVERILGDDAKAHHYLTFAAQLKASFNKTIDHGGFWDPTKGWYVYWRDADGSVHGDNLTAEVNLTALADGICDDPARRRTLLDGIESRMKAENLLVWPACFESFAPGEGADDKFPTYENGDIFLSWAEYGVKAYSKSDPAIAVKYVKRLLAQYKLDGLAFQRYLRGNGTGSGDDILAGNCNVITGLYRDIYGINPKYNRLYLEPHLTPELEGTEVNYGFRGRDLHIELSRKMIGVKNRGLTVQSPSPFGIALTANSITYFQGDRDQPAMTLQLPEKSSATLTVRDWSRQPHWTISATVTTVVGQTIHGLKPGVRYRIVSSGKSVGTLSRQHDSIRLRCQGGRATDFELRKND